MYVTDIKGVKHKIDSQQCCGCVRQRLLNQKVKVYTIIWLDACVCVHVFHFPQSYYVCTFVAKCYSGFNSMHMTEVRCSFVVKCRNTWKSTHPLFQHSCKVLKPWTLFSETNGIICWNIAVDGFHVLSELWNYKPHKVDHPWVCNALVSMQCVHNANCKN